VVFTNSLTVPQIPAQIVPVEMAKGTRVAGATVAVGDGAGLAAATGIAVGDGEVAIVGEQPTTRARSGATMTLITIKG